MSPRRIALRWWFSVPFLVLASCRDVPPAQGSGVVPKTDPQLAEHTPIEIAVLPVVNKTEGNIPAADLRESFFEALVGRRYSPLALDFVDRHVVDAGYTPGASSEQAVLRVDVERWDTSLWKSHNAILVKLTAHLIGSADAARGELWSGEVDKRFDFGSDADQFATDTARMSWVCHQVANAVLSRLPARVPKPGANP